MFAGDANSCVSSVDLVGTISIVDAKLFNVTIIDWIEIVLHLMFIKSLHGLL